TRRRGDPSWGPAALDHSALRSHGKSLRSIFLRARRCRRRGVADHGKSLRRSLFLTGEKHGDTKTQRHKGTKKAATNDSYWRSSLCLCVFVSLCFFSCCQ